MTANIAEGAKRRTRLEYARFLNIAEGSTSEAEALILVARDLELLERACADRLISGFEEISKMLYGLRTKIEKPEGR